MRASQLNWLLAVGLLLSVSGCANSPLGQEFQRSLAADSRLTDTAAPAPTVSPSPQSSPAPVPSSPSPANSPAATAPKGLSQITPFSETLSAGASGSSSGRQTTAAATFTDLDKTPKQLRQYVDDLARLGVLTPAIAKDKASASQGARFEPNKVVTRREYVRWLVSANNRLNVTRSAQQIRLATDTSQQAFQDVPPSDPDFASIQGLAEAGIIPSALSGSSNAAQFRPDAPLTRETLLQWKVPMDTRQPLPTSNLETIRQTWGFQDAIKIDPIAQRAVQADFQNGDLANIRRAFGYTTLFQPKKSVTRAEAAATLWYFGYQGEGLSAQDALKTDTASENAASENSDSRAESR